MGSQSWILVSMSGSAGKEDWEGESNIPADVSCQVIGGIGWDRSSEDCSACPEVLGKRTGRERVIYQLVSGNLSFEG